MKIVFVSNFFNHHQEFISDKLYELTEGSYRFIATSAVPEERKNLGYSEDIAPYVIQCHDDAEENPAIQQMIDEAEVVIFGSAPEILLRNRKNEKKLVFRYSERPLKNGNQLWKYPIRWFRWNRDNPAGAPIYMLCASAYTAPDYWRFGLFRNRTLRWGYFPECRRYDEFEEMLSRKDPMELLWCGRFLDWKHPDDALAVAGRLKAEGYAFRLNVLGTGDLEEYLKTIIRDRGLEDVVFLLGSKSPKEVRSYMERAGIYLFTSDRKEGWGVVLNEAMNSGCAVIASRDAGATPYLIEDGKNGLIFDGTHTDGLYKRTKYLLDHPQEQKCLGREAYETIIREWNPETAAERLMEIINRLVAAQDVMGVYDSGPCSKA